MLTTKEMTARFKTGRSWTDEAIADFAEYCEFNLRNVLDNASPELQRIARPAGNTWYFDANDTAMGFADTYNVHPYASSSITAVYSRNNGWVQNLKDTEIFLGGNYERGMMPVWSRAQVLLALNTGQWEDYYAVVMGKSAFKESGFADNIMFPHTSIRVTLDRWVWRACGVASAPSVPYNVWLAIENIFNRLAEEYGFKHGHQLQAYVWVIIRDGKVV